MANKPKNAKIDSLTLNCINVKTGRHIYTFDFARYPCFKHCTLEELENILFDGEGFWWPDADISISLEAHNNPGKYPAKVSVEWWMKNREKQLRKERAVA